MGKLHEIEIDGIKAYAERKKDAPSFAKWKITERQTGRSLLPPSWPGNLSADTLQNAIYIVQHEVIDKIGKDKIYQRINEILMQKG